MQASHSTKLESNGFEYIVRGPLGLVHQVRGTIQGSPDFKTWQKESPSVIKQVDHAQALRMRGATRTLSRAMAYRNGKDVLHPWQRGKFDPKKPRYDAGHIIGHFICMWISHKKSNTVHACDDPLNGMLPF